MAVPTKYCYMCLCEVCTRTKCPFVYAHRYEAKLYFCQACLNTQRGARLECDFFEHKQKHRSYRMKISRSETLERKVDRILKLLEEKNHEDSNT